MSQNEENGGISDEGAALPQLLPCPFCGEDWIEVHEEPSPDTPWSGCVHCGASGPTGFRVEQVVKGWNTRALLGGDAVARPPRSDTSALRERVRARIEDRNALEELMDRMVAANEAQGDYAADDIDVLRSLAGEALVPLVDYHRLLRALGDDVTTLAARPPREPDAPLACPFCDYPWTPPAGLTANSYDSCPSCRGSYSFAKPEAAPPEMPPVAVGEAVQGPLDSTKERASATATSQFGMEG